MSDTNKAILELFESRVQNEQNLPFPANIDLLFSGNEKDINLYLEHIIMHSALLIRYENGDFIYKKLVIIENSSPIDKSLFEKFADKIDINFIRTKTYEVAELEWIIKNTENSFIVIFNIEKYINSIENTEVIKALKNRQLERMEIPYFNLANNIIHLNNDLNDNYLFFDTDLYSVEIDFLEPLQEIKNLSIQGFTNSLINEDFNIIKNLKKMIETKSFLEINEYIDSLDNIYNKDFLKIQIYSELEDEKGIFQKQINEIFGKININILSAHECISLAKVAKKNFNKKITIELLTRAFSLSDDYICLRDISEICDNLSIELYEEVSEKILEKFPNSERSKIYKINSLIKSKDFEKAYNFSLCNSFEKNLVSYLKFLSENYQILSKNFYYFYTLGVSSNLNEKYLHSLFVITREYLNNKKDFQGWFILLQNFSILLNSEKAYSEYNLFAKELLKISDKLDKDDEIFNFLFFSLEYLLDFNNAGNISINTIKEKLIDLVEFSQNNGYGFAFILQFLLKKFISGNFSLEPNTELDRESISTPLNVIKENTELLMNELFESKIVIFDGSYHLFKNPQIQQETINDLLRIHSYSLIDEFNNEYIPSDEFIQFYNQELYFIYNLSRISYFKNWDLDFLRISLCKLLHIYDSQTIRNLSQYLLILTDSNQRKRIGLLGYADISHRLSNFNDALVCLALSLKEGCIPINYYYLTGILMCRLFRDLRFNDKATKVLEVMESNIKKFDINIFNSIESELIFMRLNFKFKELLLHVLSNLEDLEKLLEEVLDFYNKELSSGSDTNPSLVLAVQIYKILKTYNVNTNKFETFFQSLNFEKNTLNSLFSSILFEDFNSIFSLYKKIKGSYAENLATDLNQLGTISRAYLNNINEKNKYEVLFCLELLSEQSIKDINSKSVDAQIKLFENIDEFISVLENVANITDIIYMGLNQNQKLIIAHVTKNESISIDIKIENEFSIQEFIKWSKKFPKEYGFFDMNSDPNLFFDSIESLGINVELNRETIFIFDTEIHSLVPNIFLSSNGFIGTEFPISITPSLTWLNNTIHSDNQYKNMKAWISNDDSKDSMTLKTLEGIYVEEHILDNFSIHLDTSHFIPENLNHSKMIMITAHGGTNHKNDTFSSISDEGSINIHYKDFSHKLFSNELVILFVCNAGRFDNHPYLSSTMSLPRELLKQGCETVIASPWPLNAMMTPYWFEIFLNKWIHDKLTVTQAVYETNRQFYSRNNDPSKYLALSVFGNPLKKY
ncbi:CHAT domain-containing protein [Acinetobacter pittii]|uniref:CHAT domain-containing protein n=1 Tax=Acinetobacter pittii TaxID=48296 RepID=UPI0021CD643C|nr:CHAT domain-containing protein [Acinetobacter pittii]MCU4707763.1 CHAT domain-containing protein [Acinetobacter pittii]